MKEGRHVGDEGEQDAVQSGRGRSTIGFPYNDLGNAEELTRVLYEHGRECTPDQLAAWLIPAASPESGGFRARVTAAQTFGLIERVRGKLAVTDLADRVLDPGSAPAARVEAFLHVPLFAAVFHEYTGKRLPPASALEQHITRLGVAPKQAARARQALQRSAAHAGFFNAVTDRLVLPAVNGATPVTAPLGDTEREPASTEPAAAADPMLRGLFERLPPTSADWSETDREHWIDAARSIFILVYGPPQGSMPPQRSTTTSTD